MFFRRWLEEQQEREGEAFDAWLKGKLAPLTVLEKDGESKVVVRGGAEYQELVAAGWVDLKGQTNG